MIVNDGTLDPCELAIAIAVASFRMQRKITSGFGKGHGEAGYSFARDLPGALAELAFAKHCQLYWGGDMNDFGRHGDLSGYEVRGSTHNNAHLIVFPNDPDDRLVVLVIVNYPAFRVAGCIRAGEAKNPLYNPISGRLRPGSPEQWWVPQADLRPV